MKKTNCIFYLVDNYLYLYNFKNQKILNYKFNNFIFEGRIIKQNAMIKKINDILKNEKISKIFTTQSAYIIYEPHLKYMDKKNIIDTFEQCGFKDIKLINCLQLIDKKHNFLEVNNNYMIFYKNNKYEIIRKTSFINIENLINIISNTINENIYLIGINEKTKNLSLLNNKLFYLENHDIYFLKKIIKKLTCKNC